jgi:hypothetical protein
MHKTSYRKISWERFWTRWHQIKGKVIPLLNNLSATSRRHMGEWMYRSTFSWPRHWLELSGQLHSPAALPRENSRRYSWNDIRCSDIILEVITNTWSSPWEAESHLLDIDIIAPRERNWRNHRRAFALATSQQSGAKKFSSAEAWGSWPCASDPYMPARWIQSRL